MGPGPSRPVAQTAGAVRGERPLPVHSRSMISSLGIILPAYNEEARLGPALDELFTWLCASAELLPEE